MSHQLVHPPKARPGDRIAVLSPSFAAPGPFPQIHDQAMARHLLGDLAGRAMPRYNPDAVLCVGVPFGHTRPQRIVPHGGEVTVDGTQQRIWADYA